VQKYYETNAVNSIFICSRMYNTYSSDGQQKWLKFSLYYCIEALVGYRVNWKCFCCIVVS